MIQKSSFSNLLTCAVLGLSVSALVVSCQTKNNPVSSAKTDTPVSAEKLDTKGGARIAFVNLDTLEARYTYFKEMKATFEKRQNSIESQLNASAKQLQMEYINFQKKAQAGTLTQAEGENAQKKLAAMQQGLEEKKQNLTAQLLSDQDNFNKKVQKQLDSFLVQYNKDKHFDYIFSHVQGGGILYANPAFDITNDVVAGMNKNYADSKK